MKLTNKILLVFLILLVLLVTAYKVVFNSKVELIPNPFDKKVFYISKVINLDETKTDTFDLRGRFIVHFIQSDTAKVIINGPDNLIYNYLSVERERNIFSIISKIDLSKYSQTITISCFLNNLRSIRVSAGAIVSIKKFVDDSLNIIVADSSIVEANSCIFSQVNIIEKNNSIVMINKTKNATINLYDLSNLLLKLDGGEVNGTIGTKTDFGLEGSIKKNSVSKVLDGINRREK